MTLTELAKRAQTSVATVSKAFSGSAEIPDTTKEKIFRIAKRAGCFEKYYKGPRERRIVALVFPESESEYYGREIGLLEKELDRRGADTVIALTRFDPEREARLFSELVYRMKVDGVILAGVGKLIKNPDEVPLVILGSPSQRSLNADFVRFSTTEAILNLVGIIKEYGHRDVGFIGENLTLSKLEYFKQAMRYHGLPLREKFIAVSESERFAAAGESGMQRLIDRGAVPSVIVAAYDQIAYGAMRRASNSGYRIPEDISFAGFDDISVTQYLDVPLTSIHMHLEEVCERVVDLIFKRIENRHYRERSEIVIPATVVVRDSLYRKK